MPKTTALASIFFTVTNDLSYDQRMIRICTSLTKAGHAVTLVGVQKKDSIALSTQPFLQIRFPLLFEKGKLFYAEYNLRLFFFLLTKKMDGICAIDLDTIIPCYLISSLKKIPRIYDAHELFCEMKEIVTRPGIYKIWKWIERKTVPHFKNGYTVNQAIAGEYKKMYGSTFDVIRNLSVYDNSTKEVAREKFILYQGAVNEGRSFETLIPAMQWINSTLIICGDGNFMKQATKLVLDHQLQDKVIFKGMLLPAELKSFTDRAYIGINLIEKETFNNYYSLANRFFDYIHSALPQLCSDSPAYSELNNLYEVAVLLDDLGSENIARTVNMLLEDENTWLKLNQQCKLAAKELNWQNEEKKLVAFYKNIFG